MTLANEHNHEPKNPDTKNLTSVKVLLTEKVPKVITVKKHLCHYITPTQPQRKLIGKSIVNRLIKRVGQAHQKKGSASIKVMRKITADGKIVASEGNDSE